MQVLKTHNDYSVYNSVANSIISSIQNYQKRRRTQRLYKQWAERDGLQLEVLTVEGVKTKDAPLQVVNANSLSGKLSESREGCTQYSRPKDVLHEGPIPENIRAKVHDTIGAYAESNSRAEQRKVAMFMMAEVNKEQLRFVILLVLLGASLVIFCLGFILLIVNSFEL